MWYGKCYTALTRFQLYSTTLYRVINMKSVDVTAVTISILKIYVVHLPTSRNLLIARQMNNVNIRIVPINRVHRGGLVIMSEKKTDKTWHRKKDKERDWQWEYRTGTKRQRLRETKKDTHSNKESEGGRKIEWQNNKARGAEIMTERHKLQDIKRDRKLRNDRTDRQRGGRQWQRDKDTARQVDKEVGERQTAGQIRSKRNRKWEWGIGDRERDRKKRQERQKHAHVTPLI